jgi:hypothetical protein
MRYAFDGLEKIIAEGVDTLTSAHYAAPLPTTLSPAHERTFSDAKKGPAVDLVNNQQVQQDSFDIATMRASRYHLS